MTRKQSLYLGITKGLDYHEMVFASKKHQWPDADKLMVDLFVEFAKYITKYEKEMLLALGLPDIKKIRAGEDVEGKYVVPDNAQRQLQEIMREWLGKIYSERSSELFNKYMVKQFNVGRKHFVEKMREGKSPDYEDEYLYQVVQNGGKRISAELSLKHINEIMAHIQEMAISGKNPMQIGRWLHQATGEGRSWWWNRIARSESSLALDAAFESSMEKYQIPFEEWVCESSACLICSQFCGGVWQRGEGPEVVSDTHPNCLCLRIPRLIYEDKTREPWTRPSPYDMPYTPIELDALR